jgi:Putative restriction endonuclease
LRRRVAHEHGRSDWCESGDVKPALRNCSVGHSTFVNADGGLLRATEAVLVVEIISPGSRRTDSIIKRGEYADAGVPHYWILDLDTRVSLIACHLARQFGYQDASPITGIFEAAEPFPVRVDLDDLS